MLSTRQAFRVDTHEVDDMLNRANMGLEGQRIASGFMKELAVPYFHTRLDMNFERQGTAEGGSWRQLTEATQGFRESQGFDPTWPINVRYGDLRDWITGDSGDTAATFTSATLTYPGSASGTDLEKKLLTAQTGEGAAAARPVLDLTSIDAASLLGFLMGYFQHVMTTGSLAAFT